MARAAKKRLKVDEVHTAEPIDTSRIETGDVMTFTYRVKINGNNIVAGGQRELDVTNVDNGREFVVCGDSLVAAGLSADQFSSTIHASLTKVAEILIASRRCPFTVEFEKQDGTIRKLRGWLLSPNNVLGQSLVEDLDLSPGPNQRTVDHRKILSLIVEGVKYVVD